MFVKFGFVQFGDVVESGVGRRSHNVDFAVARRFFRGFFRPLTCHHIVSLVVFVHQIQRNHGKLCGAAALKEQDFVIVGNVHQIPQVCLSLFQNAFKHFRSMAHLHYGHA